MLSCGYREASSRGCGRACARSSPAPPTRRPVLTPRRSGNRPERPIPGPLLFPRPPKSQGLTRWHPFRNTGGWTLVPGGQRGPARTHPKASQGAPQVGPFSPTRPRHEGGSLLAAAGIAGRTGAAVRRRWCSSTKASAGDGGLAGVGAVGDRLSGARQPPPTAASVIQKHVRRRQPIRLGAVSKLAVQVATPALHGRTFGHCTGLTISCRNRGGLERSSHYGGRA